MLPDAAAAQKLLKRLLLPFDTDAPSVAVLAAQLLELDPLAFAEENVLPPLARAVASSRLPALLACFARMVVLHMLHPVLYLHLVACFRSGADYSVPEWWPEVLGTPLSIMELASFRNLSPECATGVLAGFAEHAVDILNVLNSHEPSSAHVVACLFDCPSDLVMLCILHSSTVIPHFKAHGTPLIKKQVMTILDVFRCRPELVYVAATSYSMPGAVQLMQYYSEAQLSAFKIAGNTPVSLALDLLDQGARMEVSVSPVIIACIGITAHRLEFLSRSRFSKLELYEAFNAAARKSSLLAVVTDLGYIVSCNLAKLGGHDLSSLVPAHRMFQHLTLPPIAKPNYFSTSSRFAESENGEMLRKLVEIDSLLTSLMLLLKTVLQIVDDELSSVAALGETPEIANKLVVQNVEHVLGFLLGAMICISKSGGAVAKLSTAILFELVGAIVNTPIETDKSLVWITLFNFANDVCYSDIRYVFIFEELFNHIIAQRSYAAQEELVRSGIQLFFTTFNDGSKSYPNVDSAIAWEKPSKQFVTVANSEFKFLYRGKSTKVDGSTKSGGNSGFTSSSGRQQSVHVDKYGK